MSQENVVVIGRGEKSLILKCLFLLNLNHWMHDCTGLGHQPGRTLLQTCCCL